MAWNYFDHLQKLFQSSLSLHEGNAEREIRGQKRFFLWWIIPMFAMLSPCFWPFSLFLDNNILLFLLLSMAMRHLKNVCDDNFYCDEKGLKMNKKRASWPDRTEYKKSDGKAADMFDTFVCRPLSYQDIIASKHCSFWSVRQMEKKKTVKMHSMFCKWFALFWLFNRPNWHESNHKTKGNGK